MNVYLQSVKLLGDNGHGL